MQLLIAISLLGLGLLNGTLANAQVTSGSFKDTSRSGYFHLGPINVQSVNPKTFQNESLKSPLSNSDTIHLTVPISMTIQTSGYFGINILFPDNSGHIECLNIDVPPPTSIELDFEISDDLKSGTHSIYVWATPGHCGDIGPYEQLLSNVTSVSITTVNDGTYKEKLPPIDSKNSCELQSHSSLNMDSASIIETIPLVGVPFDLHYASYRFQDNVRYLPLRMGLGGWSPSTVHRYDVMNKTLHFGDGRVRPIEAMIVNGREYWITNEAGTEVYTFNGNGDHIQTINAITGSTIQTNQYSGGKLVSITDQFGNKTTFTYSAGQVVIKSPYGQQNTLALDANGFLKSVTNPNNESHVLTNDSTGHMLTFQKPGKQKSTVTYDKYGFVTKDLGAGGDFISLIRKVDTNGVQTVLASTALSRKTLYTTTSTGPRSSDHQVNAADGSSSKASSYSEGYNSSTDFYGATSNSNLAQDPRWGWMAPFTSASTYQVPGTAINIKTATSRTITQDDPNNILSLTTMKTSTTLQGDSTRTFVETYDSNTSKFTTQSPLKRYTYRTLDFNGQLGSVQVGTLTPTSFYYDQNGRLVETDQGDRQSTITYDAHSNVSSITDPLGLKTTFAYNNANRLIKKTLPSGASIAMTYDANGNMTSITPAGKPAHSFVYNIFETLAKYLPPALAGKNPGTKTYSYNLDQQLTAVTKSDGTKIQYNYNATTGLLTSIAIPEGNYTYAYNTSSSLLKTLTSPDGVVLDYKYGGSVPVSVATSGPIKYQLQYAYNADGSVGKTTIIDSANVSSSVGFSYDKDGLLVGVGSLKLVRNNFSAISSSSLGQTNSALGYDKYGSITSEKHQYGTTVQALYEYSRDKLGRITSVKKTINGKVVTTTYAYDNLARLVKATQGTTVREYGYDANGNRIAFTNAGQKATAQVDAQDRLISFGTFKYDYSDGGELLHKIETTAQGAKTTSYTYDTLGNLQTVVLPDGKKIEYLLDGQNRRVGKKVNGTLVQAFIYDGQTRIVAELDSAGKLAKRFIYASKGNIPDYVITTAATLKVISDQVGTPNLIIDSATGKVVDEISVDEFGRVISETKPGTIPFGFAGGLWDNDTKLAHFGAREYDAVAGRWISKDPIGFDGKDSNLFGYVANDPVNGIDPSGLKATVYNFSGGIGVHIVIGVDNPNSPTGVTFIDFGPSNSKNIGYISTSPGAVGISSHYPAGLSPLKTYDTSTLQDSELIGLAKTYKLLSESGDYQYQFFSVNSKSHGSCGSFAYDLLSTVGAQ